MSSLKGTKTLTNLMTSFAGECQARTRYTFFASVAKKEGFEQISAIFTETAGNEKEHAEVMYDFMLKYTEGEEKPLMNEINASYPVAKGSTYDNLIAAAAGEHGEWSKDYPAFADIAEKEGFKDIALSYRNIAKIEKEHEERYLKFAELVKNKKVFERDENTVWKCRNCGFIYEGKSAPKICPVCYHPQSYFEVRYSN